MRKQRGPEDLGFDRYDKGRLRRALAAATGTRMYIRLKAVLLVAEGMPVTEVAKLFDKSKRVVYQWTSTYLEDHQVHPLEEGARSGRPLSAPGVTEERILRELRRNPLELGYHTTVWTVEILARHLNNCFGSSIAPRTLRRRMKLMGLRFKRPRYVYSEKDPHRTQKKGPSSES